MCEVLRVLQDNYKMYIRDDFANGFVGMVASGLAATSSTLSTFFEDSLDHWVHTIAGIGGLVVMVFSCLNLYYSFREKRRRLRGGKPWDEKPEDKV